MRSNNSFDLNRIDEETMEGPIVTSLLEDDFYKFPMGQFMWDHLQYRNAEVEWHFKNRTTNVLLANHVTEKGFMDQIDIMSKQFSLNRGEHKYLRGTNEYGKPMFTEKFLDHLCNFKVPTFKFKRTNDQQLDISWKDLSTTATYGETPVVKIVNVLFYRSILSKMRRLQREAVYAEGVKRLAEKMQVLKAHPNTRFSCFGNRRAFSPVWHEFVVSRIIEELGDQFVGTSKTSLAEKYNVTPMGTKAHELDMLAVALAFDGTKESIVNALRKVLNQWLNQYGNGLAIILADTYGTRFYLEEVLTDEIIRRLRGGRIDSMDPPEGILLHLDRFKRAGADLLESLFIPSDGLRHTDMIDISEQFSDKCRVSHGWGTHLTNDLGMPTLSIVCKPYSANGKYCVKLSDNVLKPTGNSGEIARYKNALGYNLHYEKKQDV